jgi:hypothetical protein
VRLRTPRLDFIVIGAQKAGTTSLWRYLEDHPQVRMPPDKEAPFFSEAGYPRDYRAYTRALFKDAPRRATLGTVTPAYMHGAPGLSVAEIASRIHATVPGVRLVALLRDPVERAISAHRMAVRADGETRSFDEAAVRLLDPAELERARSGPLPTASYIVAGEYGRMLAAYAMLFPREQLHVELTSDLAAEPAAVVSRVCRFVGVEPHAPARIGERFFPWGEPRVPPEAEADLKEYLARNVWPRVRHSAQHRHAFDMWFRLWNVAPGSADPRDAAPDPATVARLRAHYAEDARLLSETVGISVAWGEP